MYKCTIANDVKENAKSSSHFHLISCIYIIFLNMEKRESQFFFSDHSFEKIGYFTMGITSGNSTKEIGSGRTSTVEDVCRFQETKQTTTRGKEYLRR